MPLLIALLLLAVFLEGSSVFIKNFHADPLNTRLDANMGMFFVFLLVFLFTVEKFVQATQYYSAHFH